MSTLQHRHFQTNLFGYSLTVAACAFCLALAAYIVLVSATVAHVAGENKYSAGIGSVESTLTALEARYVGIESALTPSYAESLGLSEPASTLFVSENPSSAALSIK